MRSAVDVRVASSRSWRASGELWSGICRMLSTSASTWSGPASHETARMSHSLGPRCPKSARKPSRAPANCTTDGARRGGQRASDHRHAIVEQPADLGRRIGQTGKPPQAPRRRRGRHLAEARDQVEQRPGFACLRAGLREHRRRRRRTERRVVVPGKCVVQLGQERPGVRDQGGLRQRGQVRTAAPLREDALQIGVDLRELGRGQDLAHRPRDPGRALLARVVRTRLVRRRGRRVAEQGRVERLDRQPHPDRGHAAVREVDIEVAAEHPRDGRAVHRQLALAVDAEFDQPAQPPGQQPLLEHQRPAERARRVGQHLACVGAGVEGHALAALPVDQPAVGQPAVGQRRRRAHHCEVPPSTLMSEPVMPPPSSLASKVAMAATSSTVFSRLIADSPA